MIFYWHLPALYLPVAVAPARLAHLCKKNQAAKAKQRMHNAPCDIACCENDAARVILIPMNFDATSTIFLPIARAISTMGITQPTSAVCATPLLAQYNFLAVAPVWDACHV